MFSRDQLPESLFAISSLDFAIELFNDPIETAWFCLGSSSVGAGLDNTRHVMRRCFLIRPGSLRRAFAGLNAIGNSIGDLGLPSISTTHRPAGGQTYHYQPAHEFDLNHSGIRVEPLVSERVGERSSVFLINADLCLHLGLEETNSGSSVWVESRTGTEVLRQRSSADTFRVVEIQRNYLLRYLRDRRRALVVGHYADARVDRPTPEERALFVPGRVELERARPYRAKVFVISAPLHGALSRRFDGALHRQMHLWFCISPPALDTARTWQEQPTFDVHAFTLPTHDGDVAPERFKVSANFDLPFAGVDGDFMARVFFRQEVIERYQDSSTFSVADNGAIHCGSFWGLYRSTRLHGNEYISTAIGDFGQGVPYNEWQHWQRYAIPPPGRASLGVAASEPPIATGGTELVEAPEELNGAFGIANFDAGLDGGRLWDGDIDSVAGHRLKRYYRGEAADDAFLERATLIATLVTEEIRAAAIRPFLQHFGSNLHLSFANQPTTLQSRALLQRMALVIAIQGALRPDRTEMPSLVRRAEGADQSGEPEIRRELGNLFATVRTTFSPLAFIYDLRNVAGIAHRPDLARVGKIVQQLGLPREHWRRSDFLRLLTTVTNCVSSIARILRLGV